MSWRSMFIEDDSGWPGLGFNPAKGDTEAVGYLSSDVKAVGDELEELNRLIKSAGENGSWWEGEAAERFSKKLGELPKYLEQGSDSMHACAKALREWQTKLQDLQHDAKTLESEAIPARRAAEEDAEHWSSLRAKYEPTLGTVQVRQQSDEINRKLDYAHDKAKASIDRLNELVREGERIHANWKDRAGEAQRAIEKASENHPPDLGFWDRVTDSLKATWNDFKEWLIENADALSTWSAGLAVAAMAVNAIPVVGQVASAALGTASALCAAGAMAGHWMDNARGGKTPGWKIGLDALGVIPVVGGAAKGAIAGAKGAKGILGRTGGAAKGLVGKEARAGVMEGIENPLSMKGINWGLKKAFGKADDVLPPAATQSVIKGASAIKGIFDMGTENQKEAASASPPSGNKFHQALAV